jgi:plasmid stabilization system protein ParE
MELKWTGKALSDLARLHQFLVPVNPRVPAQIVQSLTAAPARLLEHPRLAKGWKSSGLATSAGSSSAAMKCATKSDETTIYVLRL